MDRELLEAGLDTMNFLQGLVTNLRDINSATLTGAVDVVFVQQEDGSYKSTSTMGKNKLSRGKKQEARYASILG